MKKLFAGTILGLIVGSYGLAIAATTILPATQGGTGATSLGAALIVTSNILTTCIPRTYNANATTTSWQAGTSTLIEPVAAAFTLKNLTASTNPGGTTQFFNVQFGNGSASTTMLQASSTQNINAFTSNNTFTAGQKMYVDYGTSTAPTSTFRTLALTWIECY